MSNDTTMTAAQYYQEQLAQLQKEKQDMGMLLWALVFQKGTICPDDMKAKEIDVNESVLMEAGPGADMTIIPDPANKIVKIVVKRS